MWASKCKNDLSFQINPHRCIPFSFEQRGRSMSTSWLIEYYTEIFMLQPTLRSRKLKRFIEKDHNYKSSLSIYTRVRAGALKAIIGDYKAQFGQIRDYLYGVYKKNPGTIVKFFIPIWQLTKNHACKLIWGYIPKLIGNEWSNSQAFIYVQALQSYQCVTMSTFIFFVFFINVGQNTKKMKVDIVPRSFNFHEDIINCMLQNLLEHQ